MQQQSDRVSISIRAARDWVVLFHIVILVFCVVVFLWSVLAPGGGKGGGSVLLFEVSWLVGICVLARRIAWAFCGRESIILSTTELQLSATLFGISIRRRGTPTSEVRNLRFVPSRGFGRSYKPSNITYEDVRGMAKFAAGLDESEVLTLINLISRYIRSQS